VEKGNAKPTTLFHNSITTPLTMVWGPHTWAPHHCEWSCDEVVKRLYPNHLSVEK
jgi:hypothetical protein